METSVLVLSDYEPVLAACESKIACARCTASARESKLRAARPDASRLGAFAA